MDLPDPDQCHLVYYPDPVLKRACSPVAAFEPRVDALARRMLAVMREAKGVGLAAPQVGVSIRLFVCNPTGEPEDDLVVVNPRLIELSGASEQEEGCLSLPGVNVTIRRATRVVVEAQDASGKPLHLEADDVLARIVQHEVDHLDGKLITHRMSDADEIANRRAIKQLEETYASAHR